MKTLRVQSANASHSEEQIAPQNMEILMKDIKKSRKSNGSGYTYRVGNSWKTVIKVGVLRVTATNKSKQESRRLAKEKATKVSALNKGSVVGANKLTLNDFLLPWLDGEHKLKIAHSTYRRYRGIAKHYILPALGNLYLQRISKQAYVSAHIP